jgi:hypothetical protein
MNMPFTTHGHGKHFHKQTLNLVAKSHFSIYKVMFLHVKNMKILIEGSIYLSQFKLSLKNS